ncbi:MAG: NAD(P)H-dependent oxidoreductase [Desulfobacter sp.]|nr:MAG: NAD(P)H-dependent oxidoreductase [Desulfobacter sp.]
MFVLGIQGSPRKNGNSQFLLSSFLKACEALGAKTHVIHTPGLDISPCKELLVCEKKGFCPLKDKMEILGYQMIKKADVVVLASPVFFYNVSAQAKIFIDRCQMFWGRKYKLGLKDPDRFSRQGFLLSVAASGGKRLFEGVELTAKYFFDAVSADFTGSLTYKKVEDAGDIIVRPELDQEIQEAAAHVLSQEMDKKQLFFVSDHGRSRSLMAAAFAKEEAQGRIRVSAAGLTAGEPPKQEMIKAMADCGLDLKYGSVLFPEDFAQAFEKLSPHDRVVYIGTKNQRPTDFGLPERTIIWEIPEPEPGNYKFVLDARKRIQAKVKSLGGF